MLPPVFDVTPFYGTFLFSPTCQWFGLVWQLEQPEAWITVPCLSQVSMIWFDNSSHESIIFCRSDSWWMQRIWVYHLTSISHVWPIFGLVAAEAAESLDQVTPPSPVLEVWFGLDSRMCSAILCKLSALRVLNVSPQNRHVYGYTRGILRFNNY